MERIKSVLRPFYIPIANWYHRIILQIKQPMHIMPADRTVRCICKKHYSIARFGDGEFALMTDNLPGIGYQASSEALKNKLYDVLATPNERLLICVPRCMKTVRGMKPFSRMYWSSWSLSKNHYSRIAQLLTSTAGKKYSFGDAMITRPYMDWKSSKRAEKKFKKLKQLWQHRDLLIIEGSQTRLGIGNDLFSNAGSIHRILAPAKNAFQFYSEIYQSVMRHWNGELVLIALGPSATVLASDLSRNGIQALDIGHVDIEYMWFLMRAKEKVPIPGKYTNEASDSQIQSDCDDPDYLHQIIEIIGSGRDQIHGDSICRINERL